MACNASAGFSTSVLIMGLGQIILPSPPSIPIFATVVHGTSPHMIALQELRWQSYKTCLDLGGKSYSTEEALLKTTCVHTAGNYVKVMLFGYDTQIGKFCKLKTRSNKGLEWCAFIQNTMCMREGHEWEPTCKH